MSAPPSRAAVRALEVVDFLATNPRRSFTLSELAGALDVSLSSLSSVLQALVDGGYLVRHRRHKTYELGPAMIPVGAAASARHPVVDLSRPELARLAAEYNAESVGSMRIGDQILVLALEGRPSASTRGLAVGQRIPLVPPFGEIWMAHSGHDDVRDWLSRSKVSVGDGGAFGHLVEMLDRVRERGYAVNVSSAALTAYSDALDLLLRRPTDPRLHRRLETIVAHLGGGYELLDGNPAASHEVAMIIAPVFGPDGSVVYSVTLLGLAERTGGEIERIAWALVETCLELTREIGGRVPARAGFARDAS